MKKIFFYENIFFNRTKFIEKMLPFFCIHIFVYYVCTWNVVLFTKTKYACNKFYVHQRSNGFFFAPAKRRAGEREIEKHHTATEILQCPLNCCVCTSLGSSSLFTLHSIAPSHALVLVPAINGTSQPTSHTHQMQCISMLPHVSRTSHVLYPPIYAPCYACMFSNGAKKNVVKQKRKNVQCVYGLAPTRYIHKYMYLYTIHRRKIRWLRN